MTDEIAPHPNSTWDHWKRFSSSQISDMPLCRIRTKTEPDFWLLWINPAGNYMFKVNSRNTRTRCEICSKLTIKIPDIFINFERISHLVLVFLLLTLSGFDFFYLNDFFINFRSFFPLTESFTFSANLNDLRAPLVNIIRWLKIITTSFKLKWSQC